MLQPEPTLDPVPAATSYAGIAGIGASLGERTIGTEQIAERLGVEPAWIVKRTGIHERRWVDEGTGLTDLAVAAGRAALDDAGLGPADLDLVLVATSTADEVMPHAAPLVAGALGATGAMAWDIGLACTGFLAALETAAAMIEGGRVTTALVIGAETLSKITDLDDRRTAALFGDGAGAVVLTAGGPIRVHHTVLRTDATDAQSLRVDLSERLVRMDGPLVFQRAVPGMESCCREALQRAALTPDDVALVVPHQANARITLALRERLGMDAERVVDHIGWAGNTGAATVPLALAHTDLPRGYVLLTAFGSGFASAATLVEVP